MAKTTIHSSGDLVTWQTHDGKVMTGLILEVWDSNVYEPEECQVLISSGETVVVRSRGLKPFNKLEASPA